MDTELQKNRHFVTTSITECSYGPSLVTQRYESGTRLSALPDRPRRHRVTQITSLVLQALPQCLDFVCCVCVERLRDYEIEARLIRLAGTLDPTLDEDLYPCLLQ